jgi:hypothetical protein
MKLTWTRSEAIEVLMQLLLMWAVASLVSAGQQVPRHSQSGVPVGFKVSESSSCGSNRVVSELARGGEW